MCADIVSPGLIYLLGSPQAHIYATLELYVRLIHHGAILSDDESSKDVSGDFDQLALLNELPHGLAELEEEQDLCLRLELLSDAEIRHDALHASNSESQIELEMIHQLT